MGVSCTHYVVHGVVMKSKPAMKKFWDAYEQTKDLMEFIDSYDDNAYRDKITKTKSGIHIVADGMCCKYVVVGKIMAKGRDEGIKLTQFPASGNLLVIFASHHVAKEIIKIDERLGTSFSKLPISLIAFTHWH